MIHINKYKILLLLTGLLVVGLFLATPFLHNHAGTAEESPRCIAYLLQVSLIFMVYHFLYLNYASVAVRDKLPDYSPLFIRRLFVFSSLIQRAPPAPIYL